MRPPFSIGGYVGKWPGRHPKDGFEYTGQPSDPYNFKLPALVELMPNLSNGKVTISPTAWV
ncbi:MAG: hypothetical protein K2X00_23660 [Nitrospiraceae bacterium]|nr:hypothetical protein [Nitrospiraceae bacterium]